MSFNDFVLLGYLSTGFGSSSGRHNWMSSLCGETQDTRSPWFGNRHETRLPAVYFPLFTHMYLPIKHGQIDNLLLQQDCKRQAPKTVDIITKANYKVERVSDIHCSILFSVHVKHWTWTLQKDLVRLWQNTYLQSLLLSNNSFILFFVNMHNVQQLKYRYW